MGGLFIGGRERERGGEGEDIWRPLKRREIEREREGRGGRGGGRAAFYEGT